MCLNRFVVPAKEMKVLGLPALFFIFVRVMGTCRRFKKVHEEKHPQTSLDSEINNRPKPKCHMALLTGGDPPRTKQTINIAQ